MDSNHRARFIRFFLIAFNHVLVYNIQTPISLNLMLKIFDISNSEYLINRIHSLKYLRSTTFGSKDIVIRKSEFVAKTQFLFLKKFNYWLSSFYDQIFAFGVSSWKCLISGLLLSTTSFLTAGTFKSNLSQNVPEFSLKTVNVPIKLWLHIIRKKGFHTLNNIND